MADHQDSITCLRKRHNPFSFRRAVSKRLLHKAVLAGFDHLRRKGSVGEDRRGHRYRVNTFIRQQLIQVS